MLNVYRLIHMTFINLLEYDWMLPLAISITCTNQSIITYFVDQFLQLVIGCSSTLISVSPSMINNFNAVKYLFFLT